MIKQYKSIKALATVIPIFPLTGAVLFPRCFLPLNIFEPRYLAMINDSLESGNRLINFQDYNAQTIGIILLWLSAFLTLYTAYAYVRKGIDHIISEDEKN